MRRVIAPLLFCILFCGIALAQQDPDDPGIQDSVIIGSVQADTIAAYALVPVYLVTDDSVCFGHLPLTCHSLSGGIFPSSVVFFDSPWCDEYDTLVIDPPYIQLLLSCRRPVDTQGQRLHLAQIAFTIEPDAPQQLVRIDTTFNHRLGGLLLGLCDGVTEITPAFVPGFIDYGNARAIDDAGGTLQKSGYLGDNYPNPFNASTMIDFALSSDGHVSLQIYSLLGQRMKTLVDDDMLAGVYSVAWDGRNESGIEASSGVYFYRLTTSDYSETRKMIMVR